ncbi:MAG: hypothetical protein M1812_006458 [Candelaria pacifica]|nr:MAG: hypothetical protein M1812_006458 [Candelaria pacifica]
MGNEKRAEAILADLNPLDKLLQTCAPGEVYQLQEQLRSPFIVDIALSPTGQYQNNLILLFHEVAKAGQHLVTEYLLAFGCENGISHETLIEKHTIIAGIQSNNVKVLHTFVHQYGQRGYQLIKNRGDPPTLVAFLLRNGAQLSNQPGHHLWEAARSGSLTIVRLLLEHGASVSQTGALHEAAARRRVDIVDLILQRGGDINEQLPPGVGHGTIRTSPTPLHAAAEKGQTKVVAWLLDKGADVDIKDDLEQSAIQVALNKQKFSVWEVLTAHIAKLSNK